MQAHIQDLNVGFSIVIPVYNEADNIPELETRLTRVMSDLGSSYELVFVDDGSLDRSLAMLRVIGK